MSKKTHNPPNTSQDCNYDNCLVFKEIYDLNDKIIFPYLNFKYKKEKNNYISINTYENYKKFLLYLIFYYIQTCPIESSYIQNVLEFLNKEKVFKENITIDNIIKIKINKVFCFLMNLSDENCKDFDKLKISTNYWAKKILTEYKSIHKISKEPIKSTIDLSIVNHHNQYVKQQAAEKAKSDYLNIHYAEQMKFKTAKHAELEAMNGQIATIRGILDSIQQLITANQQTSLTGDRRGFLEDREISQAQDILTRYEGNLREISTRKKALEDKLKLYGTTLNEIYDFDQELNGILQGLQSTPGAIFTEAGAGEGDKTAEEDVTGAGAVKGQEPSASGEPSSAGGSKRKRSESSTRRTTTIKKSSLKRIYKNKK